MVAKAPAEVSTDIGLNHTADEAHHHESFHHIQDRASAVSVGCVKTQMSEFTDEISQSRVASNRIFTDKN